ncbi:hypothetical protein [Candidatus Nitrosocosmicus sp. T]
MVNKIQDKIFQIQGILTNKSSSQIFATLSSTSSSSISIDVVSKLWPFLVVTRKLHYGSS